HNHTETLRATLSESDQALASTILDDLAAYRKMVAGYMPAVLQARETTDAMQRIANELNTTTQNLSEQVMADTSGMLSSALRTMLIFAGIAIVLGLLAAWVIARQITRPLAQTVAVAERISQGDL